MRLELKAHDCSCGWGLGMCNCDGIVVIGCGCGGSQCVCGWSDNHEGTYCMCEWYNGAHHECNKRDCREERGDNCQNTFNCGIKFVDKGSCNKGN